MQANSELKEEDEARAGRQADEGGNLLKIGAECEMQDLQRAKILLLRAVGVL